MQGKPVMKASRALIEEKKRVKISTEDEDEE